VTKTGTTTEATTRPYPGTRPFSQVEHDRFFGRKADSGALAERWRSNRLTIGVGRAGSGKTSLLQAGVFPIVAGERSEVLPPGRVSYGSTFPSGSLPEHNSYTLALLRSWSPGETASRLAGLSIRDFVRRRAERHDGVILAAIDQGEELLADSGLRRAASRRFLGELAEALREEPRLHLLLLVRDEAVHVLSEGLGRGARYDVTALTRQGAVEAVVEPARLAGRPFDVTAAQKLVADLQIGRSGTAETEHCAADEHVAPTLLQVVCARLWDSLPPDLGVITAREVRKYGDAGLALAAYCGHVIAAVADDHVLPVAKLRTWLQSTFVTEYGTRGTVYEGPVVTADMPNAVVRALEDQHLLSVQLRSGLRWYELPSDALIEPLREAAEQRPPPVSAEAYLQAAGRALTMGDLDIAERFAAEILHTPWDTSLRIRAETNSLLGNVAVERGEPAAAEACYRQAAELFQAAGDTESVARQLAAIGQMQLAQGRSADAVKQLLSAVDRLPNDPVLQTELGLALWQLGDGEGAVAVLTTVLGVDGGNPGALRARGEILAYLGDARNAMHDLDRVTLQNMPSTRAARGLALAELGDKSAARREIDDAIAEAPSNGPVLLYAARASKLGGDEGTAEKFASRAVDAMDPALPPPHREMALNLANRKNGKA
jgi:tetratricopeptide (TPR) repeat protein